MGGGVTSCTCHCRFRDSRMDTMAWFTGWTLVGRDVWAATGGVSIDTVQPVGGVTLRLRLRLRLKLGTLTLSMAMSLSDDDLAYCLAS